MQISIDIRGHDETTAYGRFVLQTLSQFIEPSSETHYILYTNQDSKAQLPANVDIVSIPQKKDKLFHQITFRKILDADNSHLYIFFDEFAPFGFKKESIVLIPSLTQVFFPNLGFLDAFLYKKYLHYTFQHATKILCFEKTTLRELNERLNIPESRLGVLPGFFSSDVVKPDPDTPKLDVKAKYNLDNGYLLYDAGNDANSNFERVLKIFEKLENKKAAIHLLVISESISKEVTLRQKALDMGIEKKVLFIGEILPTEEVYYYHQSCGVIFPSIYGSFPYEFSKALSYNTPIIASDLKSTTEVMADTISYCNSRSTSEATRQVEDFLKLEHSKNPYSELHKRLNSEATADALKKYVISWEQSPGK